MESVVESVAAAELLAHSCYYYSLFAVVGSVDVVAKAESLVARDWV